MACIKSCPHTPNDPVRHRVNDPVRHRVFTCSPGAPQQPSCGPPLRTWAVPWPSGEQPRPGAPVRGGERCSGRGGVGSRAGSRTSSGDSRFGVSKNAITCRVHSKVQLPAKARDALCAAHHAGKVRHILRRPERLRNSVTADLAILAHVRVIEDSRAE